MTTTTNTTATESPAPGSPPLGKPFLASAGMEALASFVRASGENAYRAGQIANWIARKWIVNPDQMSNIGLPLRRALKEAFNTEGVRLLKETEAADGSRKMLLELSGGETVECASIPAADGRLTFCLSSQVGCPVRCAFCASGSQGLIRNMETGEIVEEFLLLCRTFGRMPDNVVMMGVGEPLLNYENVVAALEILCNPEGIALAQRRVTISTSGWTPGIRRLAEHGRQWNLAVSLHAPDDKTRALLIPTKFRRDIREILEVCRLHRSRTGRLLTLEYVLLESINDSPLQARRLAAIAGEVGAKVNLIPYNRANGAFERPPREVVKRFENQLKMLHIPVTVRVEKGSDASAACGQLCVSRAMMKKGSSHDEKI